MRRVISVVLAILAGILFPLLIWVALFIAVRKPLLHVLKRAGSAALALLAGIFSPVLVWVGFGVALSHKIRDGRLRRVSNRTVGEILAAARLKVQWEAYEGESAASAIFGRQPISEIRQLLTRVGL
ncbi:MAG: hypothetical protein Q8O16_07260 [Dehalococcoidia bacterium]|nr:hypothetical protein [Dehalococcoidia bacterium]